jgi:2Fe-2S ferredoxin
MAQITYVLPNGSEHVLDIPNGRTVMEGSIRNNLPGIVAECGGSCSCATCHVYVDSGSFDGVTEEEADLLEFLDDKETCSRLSCQLVISDKIDCARIRVANSNG